jgi:hypothetical protein
VPQYPRPAQIIAPMISIAMIHHHQMHPHAAASSFRVGSVGGGFTIVMSDLLGFRIIL